MAKRNAEWDEWARLAAQQWNGKMKIWHYTIKERLDQILKDRLIKPAVAAVGAHEKPAVWFSSNQSWEETANKVLGDFADLLLLDRKKKTHEMSKGLARIGVASETAPLTWNDFKRLSGIKPKEAKDLYQLAIAIGARIGEWFVSFDAVPAEKWLAVELWDGTNWIPFDWQSTGGAAPLVYPRFADSRAMIQRPDTPDTVDVGDIRVIPDLDVDAGPA